MVSLLSFLRRKGGHLSSVLFAFCLLLFIFLRISAVDERTIHIDEGMGLRASQLALEGEWRYYPANGHGPTLFYLGAAVRVLFGDSIIAARTLTAVIGIFTITLLLWLYGSLLRSPSKIVLLGALGFSSGLVFYSAYFIHEPVFIFMTVCAVVFAEYWLRTKKPMGIIGAAVSLALMYATKETAILTWAAWGFAFAVVFVLYPSTRKSLRNLSLLSIIVAVVIAALVYVLLFSSFFANPQGVIDSILSPLHWFNRSQTIHLRPFTYFVELLFVHEFALLITSLLLAALVTAKQKWSARLTFMALWSIAMLLIYSTIRYKTPWNIPNMILPMGLFIVFAFDRLWSDAEKTTRTMLVTTLIIFFSAGFFRTIEDNFRNPNSENERSYAYLQSDESLENFMNILKGLSSLYTDGGLFSVQVIGRGDELLYVLTDQYQRSYEPFVPGMPVYINYQHSAQQMQNMLDQTGKPYVRAVFTYIQHVNQIDLFIEESLWRRYEESDFFVMPKSYDGEVYDYR